MAEFGAHLRRERERRNIPLEDIAKSTKISKRHLLELEEERFKDLPGGIFNKGFVRAYARVLELDEEKLVAEYVAAEAEAKAEATPPIGMETTKLMSSMAVAKEAQESVRRSDPAGRILSAAVALVVVLGVGGFAYKYYMEQKPARAAAPEMVPVQAKSVEIAPTKPVDLAPQATAPVPAARSALKPVFVELHATAESWVLVTADGKQSEMTLAANQTKTFTADKELTMKLGNAEAIEIKRNGKRLPAFDPGTKTHTVTFTPEL